MKTYIKNDLKRTYLVIEGSEGEKEDYQSVMLKENDIPGILKTDVRNIDNQVYYNYDISGKKSLESVCEKANLSYEEMRTLVQELSDTIWNLGRYMMDGNCLLLEPEYIFVEKGHYYFCYYPSTENTSKELFHQLTEFFVREVNYQDEKGVHFAYTFHKATMEENYSIEEILKVFFAEEMEEIVKEIQDESFIEYEHIEEKEENVDQMNENTHFWGKAKKLWGKVKSRYLEEDEKYL